MTAAATPWAARPDWAAGRVASTSRRFTGMLIFALLWNVLVWGVALGVAHDVTDGGRKPLVAAAREEPEVLLLAVFLIAGLLLLVPAVRGAGSVKRSGRSVFEMATVPGVIGGTLEGVIVTDGRLRLREDQGIRLHLKCVVTAIYKKRAVEYTSQNVTKKVIGSSLAWENDRVVNPAEVTRSGLETSIPVRMTIPASCRETAKELPSVAWLLEARAEPGHFWRAEFEVPVFRTADSPPPPEFLSDPRSLLRADFARVGEDLQRERLAAVAEPTPRPATSRIVVHPRTSEGVRIDYPATPTFLVSLALWLLTLPLWAIPLSQYPSLPLGPLASTAAPLAGMLGPVASWALALIVNGLAGLTMYYSPRRLLIGPQTITVFCGLPFLGARRRLATAEAERVAALPSHFAIVRKGQTNPLTRTFVVAPPGISHSEARWLAAEIERVLGA